MGFLDPFGQPESCSRLPGIVTGQVTDNSDPEKKGLVQVKILMLKNGEDLLDDVRVLQPYAGKAAGCYFWPEVGDFVLVALIDGSFERAFILGSFYPGGNTYMEGCFDEKNNKKSAVTRGGMRVDISDEEGKEAVSVTTPKKLTVVLKDDPETIELKGENGKTSLLLDMKNGKMELKAEKTIELVCGDSMVRLEQAGKITVQGKNRVDIKGGNIEAVANQKAKISGQEFEATGQISAKVSGQSQLELSSGGLAKLKGGLLQLNS